MATKVQKGGSWAYTIKRAGLLPKPLYLTFKDETEGDHYVARLEALLDRGIVPPEFLERGEKINTLADALREYMAAVAIPAPDKQQLGVLHEKHGALKMLAIDYEWCEDWIKAMKQEAVLSPSTIRHYVGALARCFDWVCKKHPTAMPTNPLRMLRRGYARYTDADAAAVRAMGAAPREDMERDRRLDGDEEARIRAILAGVKPEGRERAFELRYQGALELLLTLALESAMRLREMFSLDRAQVDLAKRTVFLEKTKNGDKRQVPLSTVAVAAVETYIEQVRTGGRGMKGFKVTKGGPLFPWLSEEGATLNKVTAKLSRQFARVFDAAGCKDLRFHDLRHEATSRFYERTTLSDIEIARITGHKDLRMLKRYANLRGSVLADRLW